jgi:ABC-type branched-subunit amino acid transport system substrate-binding protein
MVTLFCDAGHVLAPRMRAAKIPHVNCVCSDDSVAEGQYNFVHWPHADKECAAFADVVQKLGGKRIAIMSMRQPGWLALAAGVQQTLAARGIAVVNVTAFNPGERDFRVALLKIRETNPDLLVPLGVSPEIEIILRQAKQLDFKPRVATLEVFDVVTDFSDAEGIYYVSGGTATAQFNKDLIAAAGHGSSYGVPTIYDGLNLIRSAYETMDTPDHEKAAEWISHARDFPSAMGTISVGKGGRIDSELGYFQILHGKRVPVKLEDVK